MGAIMDTKAIIIVDDTDAVARIVQEVVNDVSGWGAVTVVDAALALEVIGAVRADLVIMDVELPGISGFELHDRLLARPDTANIEVLFTSANIDHAVEAARRGAIFLAKPFDLDDLLARVRELLYPAPPSIKQDTERERPSH